jgi:hypothetical protein
MMMGLSPMPVGSASLLRRSLQYVIPAMLVCHQWTGKNTGVLVLSFFL